MSRYSGSALSDDTSALRPSGKAAALPLDSRARAPLMQTAVAILVVNPGERLVSKIGDAVRATVNGTVAAAIVKGAVIGIAYVLAGVPHPLLFVDGCTEWLDGGVNVLGLLRSHRRRAS
jgi:hypothetical protein